MQTLKKCFWTAPSCARTSIPLVQPKKRRASDRALARRTDTKVHTAVDALGNPMRLILSAGQIADIDFATDLIADIRTNAVIADKGYDADALVQRIQASGAQAVIPPRSNRKVLRVYDTHLYKDRNLIERFFARIKHFRRIATRYEKLARSYMAFLHLVCTFVWLN